VHVISLKDSEVFQNAIQLAKHFNKRRKWPQFLFFFFFFPDFMIAVICLEEFGGLQRQGDLELVAQKLRCALYTCFSLLRDRAEIIVR